MKLEPLGDTAVAATLGSAADPATLGRVASLAASIAGAGRAGITDVVPAYATVTVFYDAARVAESSADPYAAVCELIESCAAEAGAGSRPAPARPVEIPVCYGGEFGPDLPLVAERAGIGRDEVVALHAGASYLVCAIGFTPGFPYLGGLPGALHTPRRPTPRLRVPAGSVAIGGSQTGVYPIESPGGWHVIGRTPLALFRPLLRRPALLRLGDEVRFRAISLDEFAAWT